MDNFLEQFEQLRLQTPHIGLQTVQNENSPYCQYTEKSRNCYMTFASFQSEDCMYNHRVFYCVSCNDCALCHKCELCYECLDCIGSYNCNYCVYCENCSDCNYCYYCTGCTNSFGCVGQKHGEYMIFNEKFTKAEYKERIRHIKTLPKAEIYRRVGALLISVPRAPMYGRNNENSYGENIHNCKNVYWGFDSKDLEDCSYVYFCHDNSKDLLDCSHFGFAEQCYEIMSGGNLTNCMFCFGCWFSSDIAYCDSVYSSHDCFGCVSLNHAEYCILNIPYSKEEYFQKVAEIEISMKREGTWGTWFQSTYPEVITYGL